MDGRPNQMDLCVLGEVERQPMHYPLGSWIREVIEQLRELGLVKLDLDGISREVFTLTDSARQMLAALRAGHSSRFWWKKK